MVNGVNIIGDRNNISKGMKSLFSLKQENEESLDGNRETLKWKEEMANEIKWPQSSQYIGGGNSNSDDHHCHLGAGVYWAKVSTIVMDASLIFITALWSRFAIIFSHFID